MYCPNANCWRDNQVKSLLGPSDMQISRWSYRSCSLTYICGLCLVMRSNFHSYQQGLTASKVLTLSWTPYPFLRRVPCSAHLPSSQSSSGRPATLCFLLGLSAGPDSGFSLYTSKPEETCHEFGFNVTWGTQNHSLVLGWRWGAFLFEISNSLKLSLPQLCPLVIQPSDLRTSSHIECISLVHLNLIFRFQRCIQRCI